MVLVQLVIARAEAFFDGRHLGLVLLLMHWASCGWRLVYYVRSKPLLPRVSCRPPETVQETEHTIRRAVALRFDRSITCVFRLQQSPSVLTIDKTMADGHGSRVPRPPNASRGTGTTPNNRPSDDQTRRGPSRPGGRRPPGAVARSAQSAASNSAPGALTILSRTAGTAGPVPGEGDADSRDPTSRERPAAAVNHWAGGHSPEPVAASATAASAPSDAGAAPVAAAAADDVSAGVAMDDEDGAAAAAPGPAPENRPIVIQRHKKANGAPSPTPEDVRDAAVLRRR